MQRKGPPNFLERTIDFPGQDDIPSWRGRYTFLGETTLVPRRDDKASQPGRYKFPGKTISESPHISRRERYIFPSVTIYLACGRPDPHKPLPHQTKFARGLAPKQRRLPGEDDMGALVHRNFPQSTILAAKQPADSTATAPGKVHTVLSGKDRGFWVHCPRRTQAQRSWAPGLLRKEVAGVSTSRSGQLAPPPSRRV